MRSNKVLGLSCLLLLFFGREGIQYPNESHLIRKIVLPSVSTFSYLLQNVDSNEMQKELSQSHYDMYILEPCVTEKGNEAFPIGSLIEEIRNYNRTIYNKDPIILAYVDIGQAEDWRWYWQNQWRPGHPEWIVTKDPDDWEGCYPVAFWHPEWEDIVIYGAYGKSHLEAILQNDFDGIYMDWVEAFSDEDVIEKASDDGIGDTATAMFDFIEKIRRYAQVESLHANPDFLVIAQNASDLYGEDPARYKNLMDAISVEAIWYDGTGGFDDWDDPSGYNIPTNSIYAGWTEEVLDHLNAIKGQMPIFCVEYAQDMGGDWLATDVYSRLAPPHGFIPYCTRRSLSGLSITPFPPLYLEENPRGKSKKSIIRR
jgi:cysteinyl-tRNA synthetase